MAYDNGIVTKPVNTSDVCSAIGEDKHRVGYLCVSGNINIYSKHKPMRFATLSELTTANKKSAKYGYRIPTSVQGTTIMNYFTAASTPSAWTPSSSDAPYVLMKNGWWYERPQGGETSPYRLGDFNGYNHNTNNREYFCRVMQAETLASDGVYYGFDVDIVDFSVNPNEGELFGAGEYVLCVAAVKIVSGSADLNTVKFKTGPYYLNGTKQDWIVHFTDEDVNAIFGTTGTRWDLCFMAVPINSATVTDPDSPNVGQVKPYQNYDSTDTTETTYYPRFTLNCIPIPVDKIRVTYDVPPVVITNPYEGLNFTVVGGNIVVVPTTNRVTVTLTNLTIQNTLDDRPKTVYTVGIGVIISAYGDSTGILTESDVISLAVPETSKRVDANSTANLWDETTTRTIAIDTKTFMPKPGGDSSFSGYTASLVTTVTVDNVTRIFPLGAYITYE